VINSRGGPRNEIPLLAWGEIDEERLVALMAIAAHGSRPQWSALLLNPEAGFEGCRILLVRFERIVLCLRARSTTTEPEVMRCPPAPSIDRQQIESRRNNPMTRDASLPGASIWFFNQECASTPAARRGWSTKREAAIGLGRDR
jgi:hypothetical protein